MKKTIFLLLIAIGLFACNNVEQYKERIFEIATEWDQTKSEASGIARGLANSLSLLNSARSSLNAYANANNETISPETRTQIDSLRARMTRANEDIATFMQNIGSAAKPLADNQKQMDALEAAAENEEQEFDGNVRKTINLLEESMEQTNENVEEFTQRLNAIRDEVDAIYEEVQALTEPEEEVVQ
jgi:chromosome segregation ATPase